MSATITIGPTDTKGFAYEPTSFYDDYDQAVEQQRYDDVLRDYESDLFLKKIEFIAKLERISSVDAYQHLTMVREELRENHGIPDIVIDCVIDQLHSNPYADDSNIPF
jgi:hypothetical protein